MKRKISLVAEVLLFFLLGLVLTVALSYVTLKRVADQNVIREKDNLSAGVTSDVEESLKEYKAYPWVLNYLITHKDDDLDLEYDTSEKTDQKEADFLKRHPGMLMKKMTGEEIMGLSKEDQKIFAEIVYNRWLCRMNDLKESYDASYLYFLAMDDRLEEGMFIMTASDGTRERGTGMENAFVLGVTVPVMPDQVETFRNLAHGTDHILYTEGHIDRYRYLFRVGDMNIITGMTFSIAEVTQEVEEQAFQYVGWFALLQIILSFICLMLVYVFALRPLQKVRMDVLEYAKTKDSEEVRTKLGNIVSRNEIGELAEGVSEMILEIDAHLENIRSITAEKERIGAELNVATKIQAGMLPQTFPDAPQFQVYATMDPAKEVGGDFYDFFMVDKDHLALVVADVSGKGVPAALFMVVAKTLIKDRASLGGTPAQIFQDVNNQLCESNPYEYFVTVWMAIVNIHTGEGVAANAGHEHPVLKKAGGPFEMVLYRHSPAIGIMEDMVYREHSFTLHPGDRVFCYTDGVPEATDQADELFGPERLLQSLNQAPDEEAHGLLAHMKKDIDAFVGDAMQFDDITMLIFDFLGDGKGDS